MKFIEVIKPHQTHHILMDSTLSLPLPVPHSHPYPPTYPCPQLHLYIHLYTYLHMDPRTGSREATAALERHQSRKLYDSSKRSTRTTKAATNRRQTSTRTTQAASEQNQSIKSSNRVVPGTALRTLPEQQISRKRSRATPKQHRPAKTVPEQ
jgi:hypothetical protein